MMTRDLPRIVDQVCPDVALLQGTGRLDLGRELERLGVPTALHVRDVEFREENIPFEPATVISNSKFTASRFEKKFGRKSTVIHNLFNADEYRTNQPGNKVVFINPVRKKGLDIAIGLAKKNPDIPFLFVEGWPQTKKARSRLLSDIKRLPNVTFWKRQKDMRPVYGSARIILAPSQWEEAWGRVISEAQFSGIPVLASDRGGIPEALGNGGLLLPAADLNAWQTALNRVWYDRNYWTSLSQAAHEHSERHELQPDRIIRELIKTLRYSVDKGA
ncbi:MULTISPECIES: glycosyltransferase [unclassified Thioalkalivibrio]|uniref:glycosyltransferase n=1 Tax=unclassified Thioalkalivibrio TaxID=2621013 RepID=UPI001E3E3E35|nr:MULTISPECIES: glycosyltransferase [unclassified Thioalkalivibrio]